MSTESPSVIILLGLHPLWLLIFSLIGFYAVLPKESKNDLYKCLRRAIYKTKKEELEDEHLKTETELIKAETLNKYADLLEKCRDVGVAPSELISPGEDKKSLPPALINPELKGVNYLIKQHQDGLAIQIPRRDIFKTVLLLRQEGFLTNSLGDQELANLFEILSENFDREYQSVRKQTDDFEVDIEEEEKKK
jgi:hypothetical protein